LLSAPSQSALQAETDARLRFEMLLADVCAQFVNVASADVDPTIENAQRVICESLRGGSFLRVAGLKGKP